MPRARRRARCGVLVGATLAILAPAPVAAAEICRIDRIRGPQLYECPFELDTGATVHVRAVGSGTNDFDALLCYAWILDADRREPAWVMTVENTQPAARNDENRVFDDHVDLPSGRYIAYFSAHDRHVVRGKPIRILGKSIAVLRTSRGFLYRWDSLGNPRRMALRLESADSDIPRGAIRPFDGRIRGSEAIRMAPLGNDATESAAFRVSRRVDVEVRALAEYDYNNERYADGARLVEAWTRNVIWAPDIHDAEPAGGAEKNHIHRIRLTLAPGEYVLKATTDDTHAYESWLEAPPFDPQGWGVTLDAVEADDRDAIETIADPKDRLLLVSIDRVRNSSYVRKAFVVSAPMRVRVEGTGELNHYRREVQLVDYGWIERMPEREIVYSMENRKGRHAGGHGKNRLIEDEIELEPGAYMLCYITDDSHAYGDWSALQPGRDIGWGVGVYLADRSGDREAVRLVDVSEVDPAVISLAPTGDHTYRKQLMTLPESYDLRILCLGEGVDGRMYDYGWIEAVDSGRTVWKMRYDDCSPAGGARKNLMVDTVITLEAGRYRVHYRTDDSHSFEGWNQERPWRAELWGISIYLAGEGPRIDPR